MRSLSLLLLAVVPVAASAQGTVLVYRLGKDTLAVEQYTRTSTGISGEMVQRAGAAVVRFSYSMTLGKDGRPTAATISATGSAIPISGPRPTI